MGAMLCLYSHVLQPIQSVPTSAGTLQPALHDYSAVIKIEADHVEAIFHRCSLTLGGHSARELHASRRAGH